MGHSNDQSTAEVLERLRVASAAAYLGLSEQTLHKMRSQGRGPRYVKLGGRVFYRRTDLDAYLSASTVETADSRKDAA
ncbi:hypothetical protein ASE10_09260 [Lysobacter sp. Root76]|nr:MULTISPECIES: helix-turn-helix domain-containing protein [unclassified Lysobacter]KRC34866.1 hypothetical protein ASE10_09260 [Lysobacter sp. Root76]KRD70555.1 hypothetical protein ASE45_01430 [Lysobacter sp. Root96]